MTQRLIYLLLVTLSLLQYSLCLPMPETEAAEQNAHTQAAYPQTITTTTTTTATSPTSAECTESAPTNSRKRFVAVVYKNYSDLLNFQLQRTNQIAKDVLADASMSSIDSMAMESERTILEKYVKNSKDALVAVIPDKQNDQQNRFFFAVGKEFLLEDFNSFTPKRDLRPKLLKAEKQITWNILKKHGLTEYVIERENRTRAFTNALVDEFESYITSFRMSEKVNESEFLNLWNMYTKNELGVNKLEFGKHLFSVFFHYEPKY